MSIKAIFFDFDDTLGDRNQYAWSLWHRAVTENTEETDPIVIEAIVQDCLIWDENGTVSKMYIVNKLKEEYGIELSYPDFHEWWNTNLNQYAVAFPDARRTLEELKRRGYKIGLITNGPSAGQRKKAENAHLIDLLDDIVVSKDFNIFKPDVRLFQIAAERMQVKPEECVMVGDIFSKDILGAYRAGMKPVWIWTWGNRPCAADVTVIHSVSELLELDFLKQ